MQYVEAVTKGQPDKVCDQIADAILEEYLRRDPETRLSISVFGSNGMVAVGGEALSLADFDISPTIQRVCREVGYVDDIDPFVNIASESPDTLFADRRGGASDSCIVNGYATNATPQFLPKPFVVAQAIARRLDELREADAEFSWLRPDGKVLVGSEGPSIKTIVITVSHEEHVDEAMLRTRLFERAVAPIIGSTDGIRVSINRQGFIRQGGFISDAGMSGRKTACDAYGGLMPWSTAAFSGKDPMRIERLASYYCRFAAKNLVAKGIARTVMINAVYERGHDMPVFLRARTGEGKDVPSSALERFDFRPTAMADALQLKQVPFRQTACYGHFGRDGFPWERIIS